jgi:aminoglycoside 3-N-acetyltransferase
MLAESARAAAGLAAELTALGVQPDQDLLVHSSLRQVGPIDGGAETMLRALRAAVGPKSTLVVPAQTTENSLSSTAFLAATAELAPAQLGKFVAAMPGFDPAATPSSGMGILAEYLRTRPGAMRSNHPQSSFAALGPRAADCVAGHELGCHLGEQSPLGWLYRADAAVLLLGVGYAACTVFHLAEYRLPGKTPMRQYQCFTALGGVRAGHTFTDIVLDDSDFEALGARIDYEPFMHRGQVGAAADCRMMPVREAVDFAAAWAPFRLRRAVP